MLKDNCTAKEIDLSCVLFLSLFFFNHNASPFFQQDIFFGGGDYSSAISYQASKTATVNTTSLSFGSSPPGLPGIVVTRPICLQHCRNVFSPHPYIETEMQNSAVEMSTVFEIFRIKSPHQKVGQLNQTTFSSKFL